MGRRFFVGRGRGLRTRRTGLGYGGAILLILGAILLVLYLVGGLRLEALMRLHDS